MRILLILVALNVLGWSGEVEDGDRVFTVNIGMAHSNETGNATGIDLEGQILFSALSIESYYDRDAERKEFTNRIYIGPGLGPLIQTQLGLGDGGPSLRLRSNINLLHMFSEGRFKGDSFGDIMDHVIRYDEKSYKTGAPMISLFIDKSKHDIRLGLLLGILL